MGAFSLIVVINLLNRSRCNHAPYYCFGCFEQMISLFRMISSHPLPYSAVTLNIYPAAIFGRELHVTCRRCAMQRSGANGQLAIHRRGLSSSKSPSNYYDVLGVKNSANSDEIKKAFLAKSKELHPDRNRNQGSHSNFVRLNEAYSTLKNEESRQLYDLQHGIKRSHNADSPFQGDGAQMSNGKLYYESYNPTTGKIEWKVYDFPNPSAHRPNPYWNPRAYHEYQQRQNSSGSSSHYNPRPDGMSGSQAFLRIASYYMGTFLVLFVFTIVTAGAVNLQDYRFRRLDYDRLMYLDQHAMDQQRASQMSIKQQDKCGTKLSSGKVDRYDPTQDR